MPLRSLTVIVVVVVVMLSAVLRAPAQGTMGTLPDPISTDALNQYAKRLKLSPQQLKAAEAMHDQYKAEFRELREGEIAEFLSSMRELSESQTQMPSRKKLEEFVNTMKLLNGKIARVDANLFDQLQTVLTGDQLGMLPRIRHARQRDRYDGQNMMMWGMSGGRADLSDFFFELDLTPEQFQAADPIIAQYESKLTAGMDKMYETTSTMMLRAFEEMEKLGVTEESMTDPETMQKMQEAMQEIWKNVMKEQMEQGAALSDLNRRTARSVAAVLPTEKARNFRERFYTQAYPQAGFALASQHQIAFDHALKLDELTDEQRQAVTVQREEFYRKMDAIVEKIIDAHDKLMEDRDPFEAYMWSEEQQTEIAKLQAEAAEALQSATAQLTQTLGPELAQKAQLATIEAAQNAAAQVAKAPFAAGEMQIEAAEAADAAQGDDQGEAGADSAQAWGGDQFLPGRISQRQMMDYAEMLGLSDDQRSVFKDLFKGYKDRFDLIAQNELTKLTQATQKLWAYDQTTGRATGPDPDMIDQIYELRGAAMIAIQQADAAFFDEVEMALVTPEQAPKLARVRLVRQRARFIRQDHGFWFGGESNEGSIDVSLLVRRHQLTADQLDSLAETLSTYEQAVTPAFGDRYQASLEMSKAQEHWSAEVNRMQASGENWSMEWGTKYQALLEAPSNRVNAANAAIVKLNREAVAKITEALPADAAYRLRSTYNRQAFPNIYNDPTSVENHLSMALSFDDLTDEQRSKLSDLSAEYRPAYLGFCEQMVEISASGGQMMMGQFDPEQFQDYQKREEQMAKLRFDRSELSSRSAGQIKSILTEDQLNRLGGLPKPQDDNPYTMW